MEEYLEFAKYNNNGKLHNKIVNAIKKYIIEEQIMDKYIIVTTLCDKEETVNK